MENLNYKRNYCLETQKDAVFIVETLHVIYRAAKHIRKLIIRKT